MLVMFSSRLALFLYVLAQFSNNVQSINLCGDWYQYKDIKCIKVLEKVVTEEEALKQCLQLENSSSLLTIHSKEEQEAINSLISKYNTLSDRAWIGLKYENGSFGWSDGTQLDFADWADDAVKDGSDPCVQMSSVKPTLGKWTDESCKKTALIVCQKKQELNLNVLRFAIENITETYEKIISDQKKDIEDLKNNILPIGFIYTQLPNQSEPQDLWSNTKWSEVTEEYSGLFFRAEGDTSAPFGQIQQANQSVISDWQAQFNQAYNTGNNNYSPIQKSLNQKDWSSIGHSSTSSSNGYTTTAPTNDYLYYIYGLSFYETLGEVRPRNTAIRFWKRVQ